MSFDLNQIKILQNSANDFCYFVNNVFSKSSKDFTGGKYIDETTKFLSGNDRTIRVSARNHFKSYAFYAYFMWKLMFTGSTSDIEAHYFSFNADLASYHVNKIKSTISANPFFADIIDSKPTAESVLRYTWNRKHYVTLKPHGLIQFKRGIHCDCVFVDDPFQDPDNELNPSSIYKINEIFKSNILDMPHADGGILHVAGTPQTNSDFFFDKNITNRFKVKIQPAITNEGKALWPEWMDLEELEKKRIERTDRIFKREYLCTPVYSSKGFFDKDRLIEKIVNPNLTSLDVNIPRKTENHVIAGFDIGKKTHPSHLVIFEETNGKLIMLHQKWMDGWSYSNGAEFDPAIPTQLEYLKLAILNFKIQTLHYDSTRAEFESFDEQGLLPPEMIPVVFTSKSRQTMATCFDRLVEREQLEIINDDRLIGQICALTNDLQAISSTQGHGDSFWSCGLAFLGSRDILTYDDGSLGILRRQIRTGGTSIFNTNIQIPSGW